MRDLGAKRLRSLPSELRERFRELAKEAPDVRRPDLPVSPQAAINGIELPLNRKLLPLSQPYFETLFELLNGPILWARLIYGNRQVLGGHLGAITEGD